MPPKNKMFIESLARRYPKRVLKTLALEYQGFTAFFDVSNGKSLKLTINAYTHNDEIEIYEFAVGSSKHQFWLNHVYHEKVTGIDLLSSLKKWLLVTIGGIENSYEGSFAETILAAMRNEE